MQEIIKRAALIEFGEVSGDEIIGLYAEFFNTLITLREEERSKYKSIYWKLAFAVQKELGFQTAKQKLEAGSKNEIRKKQNKDD